MKYLHIYIYIIYYIYILHYIYTYYIYICIHIIYIYYIHIIYYKLYYIYIHIWSYIIGFWLVVEPPLWKIWLRQLGWWNSQYMESHKRHVPSHQPAITGTKRFSMTISEIRMSFGSTGSYKVVPPPVVGIAWTAGEVNRTPSFHDGFCWCIELIYRTYVVNGVLVVFVGDISN